jgi:mRNA export factor
MVAWLLDSFSHTFLRCTVLYSYVDNKQRLKGFAAIQQPIPCASFNAQGQLFAYASCYDWSKGSQFHIPGTPNEIYIHYTAEDEIKPKGKKR